MSMGFAIGHGNKLEALFQARMQRDSATVISLRPYKGRYVDVGGLLVEVPSAGFTRAATDVKIEGDGTLSASSLISGTLYYAYVSNKLVTHAPEQLRLSSVGPTTVNGEKYLGSSGHTANWRFVGWVRTNGSNQFVDSETQRLVVNYHNRLLACMMTCPAYSDNNAQTQWTTTSTTWTPANGSTGDSLEFIANGEDAVAYFARASLDSTSANFGRIGVGEDSTTTARVAGTSRDVQSQSVSASWLASEGFRQLRLLVSVSAGTGTYFADFVRYGGSSDPRVTYLSAEVWT